MKKKSFYVGIISMLVVVCSLAFCIKEYQSTALVNVSSNGLDSFESLKNKKIGWGIKRANNHIQPDVGAENKRIMDKYNGMCLGNSEKKYVYLTFDSGYEAGYTNKILEVLKNNNVKATFFITAHYLNTEPELVGKMIEDGHTVGNHAPKFLMSGIEKL